MKILFVTPGVATKHGGYRMIFEVAARMMKLGHEVAIHSLAKDTCDWFTFPPGLAFQREYSPAGFDCMVLCSPHSIDLASRPDCPPRVVLFCQMLEDRFRPEDRVWAEKCRRYYSSRHPLICPSEWNIREIKKLKPLNAPVYYVGTGVNLEDFPIEEVEKDGKTVLVEGWECGNAAKDVENLGPKVAKRLKAEGYNIVAYSAVPLKTMPEAVNEYHFCPSLATMNDLYRRATILLKATKYDARACAPMEAMTKGTVTARAIIEGDDDLNETNSIRTEYKEDALYRAAKTLLTDAPRRKRLAAECLRHVRVHSWDYWMRKFDFAVRGTDERVSTAIVSIVYKEPTWQKTRECVEAAGVPVVFVERNPEGVGSLTESINRGYAEALKRFPKVEFVWFVTNVTFDSKMLPRLETAMNANPNYAIIHPAFLSDHLFCRKQSPLQGVQPVPFVEFTAPIVRRSQVDGLLPLNEKMPYWGQDMDFGARVRAKGLLVGVDHTCELGHTYIRHTKGGHDATVRRAALRKATDKSTTAELIRIYGPDWAKVLGYQQ